jgi:Xaa-Pro aminopeptidase
MPADRSYYVTVEVPFPSEDYEWRLTRVRDRMRAADVDVKYVTEPESLYYLTGYQNSWFRSHSPREWPPITCAVVPRDHDGVLFIEGAEDEYLARSATSSVPAAVPGRCGS